MGEITVIGTSCTSESPPILFSDNLGATYLSANHIFYSHMKHLMIDYHFVHDPLQSFELRVVYVSVGNQFTDTFTRSLSRSQLFYLYNKIDVIFITSS